MLRRVFVLALAAVGLIVAPYASAQIKGFVGGGLGFNTIAADNAFVSPGNPDDKSTTGMSNPALQIEGGVLFNTNGPVVWGLGLYVHPLAYKANDESNGAGFTLETEVKNVIGVFGEIGFKLAQATVAYGRLSFNQAKVEAELNQPGGPNGTLSETFTGVGVGVGVRHTLSGSMYLFVDWHHIIGSEATITDNAILGPNNSFKITPSITTGLIGLGWMFP